MSFWRLIACVFLLFCVPQIVCAYTKAQAYQNCVNWAGHVGPGASDTQYTCTDHPAFMRYDLIHNGEAVTYYQYDPPLPCAQRDSYPASYGSNIAVCNAGCMYAPTSDGTTDSVRSGSWAAQLTQSTYRPTGETCSADAEPPPTKSPTLCGGSSCHDTAAGTFCAVGSAGQVCVTDHPAPGAPGGCVTSGDTTICAGQPPPSPGNPPIADPVTGIVGSDTYGHQSGAGAITNTTVNNYNNNGTPPANGAAAGDAGSAPGSTNVKPGSSNDPASSSTSAAKPSDNTHASGGVTCDTPPICEGNQATCMVVTQTWLGRCKGDGSTSNDSDVSVPGLDGIGDGTVTNGGKPWFQDGGSLLDKLDATGFGGGSQCPAMPSISIPMVNLQFDGPWPHWCEILHGAGYVILLLAGFLALRILAD